MMSGYLVDLQAVLDGTLTSGTGEDTLIEEVSALVREPANGFTNTVPSYFYSDLQGVDPRFVVACLEAIAGKTLPEFCTGTSRVIREFEEIIVTDTENTPPRYGSLVYTKTAETWSVFFAPEYDDTAQRRNPALLTPLFVAGGILELLNAFAQNISPNMIADRRRKHEKRISERT